MLCHNGTFTMGVHPDWQGQGLGRALFEGVMDWAKGAGLMDAGTGGEVVLFQTCYVQGNEPQIGMDTVEVLEKNGGDVRCEKGLECCGMPAWERGDLETVRKNAAASSSSTRWSTS